MMSKSFGLNYDSRPYGYHKSRRAQAQREAPATQDERLSWLVQQNDKKLLRCQEFLEFFVIRSNNSNRKNHPLLEGLLPTGNES